MSSRSRSGRIRHRPRDVSTCRPMHLTAKLLPGLPSLRRRGLLAEFRGLRDRAREAGVRTVAYALMDDHIHWIVIAESRAALAAATRLVFGQLARRINRVAGRVRGRVFADRFWSSSGRSVRQAFQMVAYVLRNPYDAACLPALEGPIDPYLERCPLALGTPGHASDRRWDHPAALELAWGQSCRRRDGPSDGRRRTRPCPGQTGSALGLDLPLLSADRFLRSVFGPRGPDRDALLLRMLTERVPFVPLAVRRQATLPGLA